MLQDVFHEMGVDSGYCNYSSSYYSNNWVLFTNNSRDSFQIMFTLSFFCIWIQTSAETISVFHTQEIEASSRRKGNASSLQIPNAFDSFLWRRVNYLKQFRKMLESSDERVAPGSRRCGQNEEDLRVWSHLLKKENSWQGHHAQKSSLASVWSASRREAWDSGRMILTLRSVAWKTQSQRHSLSPYAQRGRGFLSEEECGRRHDRIILIKITKFHRELHLCWVNRKVPLKVQRFVVNSPKRFNESAL